MLRSLSLLARSAPVAISLLAFVACGTEDDSALFSDGGSGGGAGAHSGGSGHGGAGSGNAGAGTHFGGAGGLGTAGSMNHAGAAGASVAGAGGNPASGGASHAGAGGNPAAGSGGSHAGAGGTAGASGGAAVGPAPVFLGTAGKFVILAESEITNVPTSAITGDVGLSPAAASYIKGFDLTRAGIKLTSPQVVGNIFAADSDPPTPTNMTVAVADMLLAYTDAAGRPTPDFLNLGGGLIGGLTLKPGLYKWASSVSITADVTLSGKDNDVWIFQITGDLKMSSMKAMTLAGNAKAKNIFWQVAGLVDFGTSSHAEGALLCKTGINLGTGATINGRLLAQTAVTLASNSVTVPAQ